MKNAHCIIFSLNKLIQVKLLLNCSVFVCGLFKLYQNQVITELESPFSGETHPGRYFQKMPLLPPFQTICSETALKFCANQIY